MLRPTVSSPDFLRGAKPRAGWRGVVMTDVGGFCAFAMVSLLVGLLINAGKRQPLPLVYRTPEERLRATVARLSADKPSVPVDKSPVPPAGPQEMGLDRFQAFALEQKGVVIDARPALIYGLGHVPGAINLSRIDFDVDYRRLDAMLGARKEDPVAVYCSGADCQDSQLVASALQKLGFRRLFVYTEGWEEWSQSGLPQEK